MLKFAKKALSLLVLGPIVGLYTFFSKHWLVNSMVGFWAGVVISAELALPVPALIATCLIGYLLTAAIVGMVQQIGAFIYNWNYTDCHDRTSAIVPEISYAAYKGLCYVNGSVIAIEAAEEAENHTQRSEPSQTSQGIYGEATANFLLFSAGHMNCINRCHNFSPWEEKEETARDCTPR